MEKHARCGFGTHEESAFWIRRRDPLHIGIACLTSTLSYSDGNVHIVRFSRKRDHVLTVYNTQLKSQCNKRINCVHCNCMFSMVFFIFYFFFIREFYLRRVHLTITSRGIRSHCYVGGLCVVFRLCGVNLRVRLWWVYRGIRLRVVRDSGRLCSLAVNTGRQQARQSE